MRRLALLLFAIATGTACAEPDAPAPAPPQPAATGAKTEAAVDKIWSGVVMATNAASPKLPPPELQDFASRLRRTFGYNQFELVGSAIEKIDEEREHWLVPTPNFWFAVKARRATSKEARGGYLLNLQLFQDKRPLVDTEAKLAPGSPLFIRGPQCGKGQLIIVLQVQH
jgi:hypothetical protein